MVKKIKKYFKFIVSCALIMSLVAPSYAALSASDGSAFVTKAEFDSALADFNARLTTFEAGINSKIDSQVTSYLDRNGIWNGKEQTISKTTFQKSWGAASKKELNDKDYYFEWLDPGAGGLNLYCLKFADNAEDAQASNNISNYSVNYTGGYLKLKNLTNISARTHCNNRDKITGAVKEMSPFSEDMPWFKCTKSGLLNTSFDWRANWAENNGSFSEFEVACVYGNFGNVGPMASFALGAGIYLEEWGTSNFTIDTPVDVKRTKICYNFTYPGITISNLYKTANYGKSTKGTGRIMQIPAYIVPTNCFTFVSKDKYYLYNPFVDYFDAADRWVYLPLEINNKVWAWKCLGGCSLSNMKATVY